jgi:SWI/SNF-related matrix-associated actin-dependent regulator 1 of chromatin subfamily A
LNYDILPKWTPYLLQIDPQALILDEIHYLKTRTTQRTKAARKLAQRIPHVIGLSGTPMTNRPAELWSPLNIIRPDLYPAFFPFAQRYCAAKKGFWGWDFTGQSNLDELNQNLRKSVMIRRTKAEVLTQLPPKTRTPIQIDLENRREYQLAHNNFLQWLAKVRPEKIKGAIRSQALVKLGYLKRLAARLKLKNALQWVDEFLETTDEKIVIFAIHKEPIEIITKRYEHTQVTVDGSVIGKKRQWAVDKFQKNKDCRVFIGNIHAAGIGITLTAASTVAFFELDWTPGNHTQAEDRCHRIGTTQPVNCYYLTAKDTIEDNLLKLIRKKQKIITTAIDGKPTDEFDILTELLNL